MFLSKIVWEEMSESQQVGYVFKLIGLGIVCLIVLFGSFRIISAGERGVKLTLGKVHEEVLGEGLQFKFPLIQKIVKLDVKIQKEEIKATAASKDLQDVNAIIALNYHLESERVNKLWQNIGKDYKVRIIDPAIQESVKAATAKYTAEELITKRQAVKDEIKSILFVRLQKEFILVDDLSIVDFQFSGSFSRAIEDKVTAEQQALQAKNKLEQIKFEAEQRITSAKAEAEAIRIQAQAITQQGGREYVNLKWVEKWNGTLPQTVLGDAVPLINLSK